MIRVVSFLEALAFFLFFFCTQAYIYADTSSKLKQAQSCYENSNYQDALIIYQSIIKQSTNPDDAIEAQKGLVMIHIAYGEQAEAESAYQQLLSNFPHNTHMADVLHHGIACCYRKFNKTDKANEIDKFVMQNWSTSESAMWSQVDIIKSAINGNDYAVTQTGVDNLLATYINNIHLGDAIHSVAYSYRQSCNTAKADELDKYVINHYPKTEGAMWAQVDVIQSSFDNKKYDAVKTGVNNLLADFSSNINVANIMHTIAYKYRQVNETAKANEIDKYTFEHWASSEAALWSKVDYLKSNIVDGDFTDAVVDTDKLLEKFSDEEQLVFGVLAFQIVDTSRDLTQDEKVYRFYKKLANNWPGKEHTIWSQTVAVLANIGLGDITATNEAIDRLQKDFSNDLKFPNVSLIVSEKCYEKGKSINSNKYDEILIKAIELLDNTSKQQIADNKLKSSICYVEGLICQTAGDYQKAIEAYKNTIEINSKHEYADYCLYAQGQNYQRLVQQKAISESDAKSLIQSVYTELVLKFPASNYAKHANYWLKNNK